MEVKVPNWCGASTPLASDFGPCTTSYLDFHRVSQADCLLVTSDGRFRFESGLWDATGTNARSLEGHLTPPQLAQLASILDPAKLDLSRPAPTSRTGEHTLISPDKVPRSEQFLVEVVRSDGSRTLGVFPTKQAWRPVRAHLYPLFTWWDRLHRQFLGRISDSRLNNCSALLSDH